MRKGLKLFVVCVEGGRRRGWRGGELLHLESGDGRVVCVILGMGMGWDGVGW